MTRSGLVTSKHSGFVLISVLWFVALLMVITMSVSHASRQSVATASSLVTGTESRYLSDGAAQMVIANLLSLEKTERLLADGETFTIEAPGGPVQATVSDESGKVDINFSGKRLLSSLIVSTGEDRETAEALAAAIIDYRDSDTFRSNNGAEDEDYEAAGLGWQAKDELFTGIEELLKVYGMNPQIYAAIASSVTVHGYQRRRQP